MRENDGSKIRPEKRRFQFEAAPSCLNWKRRDNCHRGGDLSDNKVQVELQQAVSVLNGYDWCPFADCPGGADTAAPPFFISSARRLFLKYDA